MKRWRVTQHRYAKYGIVGRSEGEYLDEEYTDYRYRWFAKFMAIWYSGTSIGGLIELRTEVTDLKEAS